MRTSTLPSNRETGMVRLYAWVMVITAGLAVGVALFGTRTAPQYASTAEILISPTLTPSGNYIEPSMPTEQRVAISADVISNAAAKLGVTSKEALDHLSVTVPVDTKVLVMSYTAGTRTAARSGADAFAQTYLRARNPADGKNAVASLVSPPALPSKPVGTNYPVVLGVAVLAGLLIGFGVARAWDRVRGRIRTIGDAERCAELDALLVTPPLPRTSIGGTRLLAGRAQLDSLAARVLGQVEEGSQSSLLVTGAAPACGSTAVAVLTALALARMGRVVVLVTADDEVVTRMSRNRESQRGKNGRPSRDVWPDAQPAEQEGLHLVSMSEWDGAGVAASRLTNLLPELHERLPEALIVVDGPPAWRSAGIALRVDKILLVVALGRCSRKATTFAVQALDHCAEKMMGLVITPRRRRTGHEAVSVRGWASRQARRIMFRVAPPSANPALVPSRWSRFGDTPTATVWTDQMDIQPILSTPSEPDRNGSARRPKPQPSGEPNPSVLS